GPAGLAAGRRRVGARRRGRRGRGGESRTGRAVPWRQRGRAGVPGGAGHEEDEGLGQSEAHHGPSPRTLEPELRPMAGEPPPSGGQRAIGAAGRFLLLLGRFVGWATRPLQRRWHSSDPLDAYSLVHMASVAGATLVAIALADSVFFSLKPDEARIHVALYLGLTMAPLAVAAPLLVPLLDRGGFRRAISFGAAGGRMLAALIAAPQAKSLLLFPVAFALLVLSKVHGITKNGLTVAYAPSEEGLLRVNARMGRLAAVAAVVAAGPGVIVLKIAGSTGVLYLAALAYAVTAVLNLRLPQP